MWTYNYSNELYHHGVKGMKWGVRRYQNYDGTLNERGVRRYNRIVGRAERKANKTDNFHYGVSAARNVYLPGLRKNTKAYNAAVREANQHKVTTVNQLKVAKAKYKANPTEANRKAYNHLKGTVGRKRVTNVLTAGGLYTHNVNVYAKAGYGPTATALLSMTVPAIEYNPIAQALYTHKVKKTGGKTMVF